MRWMVAAFSAGFGMLAGFALDSGGGTGASRSDRAGTASASPEPEAGAGRRPDTTVWHVSEGSAPDGDGSSERPFTTIAEALGRAAPGDEVSVGPGVYPGFSTVRSGEPDAPIVVKGAAAAIRGDEDHEGHLVEVLHDHITISGFDIARADIPLWIFGASGVRIANNVIRDAAGECLRIKYQAAGNEIVGNRIEDCGGDFDADDDEKNGEGIYIGTSPEQLDRNPTGEADASDRNWVHGNVIDTPAECVDIKEGASENVVEHNRCSGGEDPDGAGLSSRGNGNIFRHNISRGHDGAGIRLGGDTMSDGVDNVVVANRFEDNDGFGVKVQRSPQRQLCGNELSGNDDHHNGPVDPAAPC